MWPIDEKAVEQILKELGCFGTISQASFLGEGEFSMAWLVNGQSVCRFAKHATAARTLLREACLLPQVAASLPLPIPRPVCYEVESDPPLTVAVHSLVAGESMTPEQFFALDNAVQECCARQLASFLADFHKLHVPLAESCGVKQVEYAARYADVQRIADEHLTTRLDDTDRRYVRNLFDSFLSKKPEQGQIPQVLLHGDLSPEHVLWSPAQQRVVGILDFGDMEIGDPAWDLVYLWEDYGPPFLRRFMHHFPASDPKALLGRAYKFRQLDAVEWAAYVCAGMRGGDPQEYLDAITAFRLLEEGEPWDGILDE